MQHAICANCDRLEPATGSACIAFAAFFLLLPERGNRVECLSNHDSRTKEGTNDWNTRNRTK